MTATMNPTAIFQHYIQNSFKFPKEIKNDIVYCQRALKAHIKVHQMVLDVFKTQGNSNPAEKQRITDELESQIYEINAEQQFLLLRLRRLISDFHKNLERKGVHVIPNLLNEIISSELVPLINDKHYLIYPISIRLRSTEDQLIEKYFEVKRNDEPSDYFEILDSDEEENVQNDAAKPKPSYKPISPTAITSKTPTEVCDNRQKSLRKSLDQPKSTQIEHSSAIPSVPNTSAFVELSNEAVKENSKGFSKITPNMTVSTMTRKSEPTPASVYPVSISISKNVIEKEKDDSSVPQNVKMSRLNLRQVLKKAQNGNLVDRPVVNVPAASQSSSTERKELMPVKKPEQNSRDPQRTVRTTVTLSSSSDDSTPERCLEPPKAGSQFPTETVETRIKPEDYGQEMFLRMFGLFTPEMRLQMQQRRSKRKRRTVQSNERSDYHYGHIELQHSYAPVEEKKKRKAFLLSPQVKRKQGRPPKRRSVEKSEENTTSRSGSSSPDERRSCKQCLKIGGLMECCDVCKYYYHQSCHSIKEKSSYPKKAKICPPCRRQQENETEHKESLHMSVDKLQQQLRAQKTRRKSLQQKSEKFKRQMSALFKIIKSIKSDPACNLD